MSAIGEQINFVELFERHDQIRIPLIQRDYAQGSNSVSNLRDDFLGALGGALRLPVDDPYLPLNLDFIYGSVESDGESRFAPLDGQQRLTTLFLLHWYLAWVDDCLDSFRVKFQANGHSRLSYRVRPSSGEFFDSLVNFNPERRPDTVACVSDWFKDQPWYFRNWRLDPTIQSSLDMLDALHGRFARSPGLYARLIDEEHPAITFQLLDLNDFGLSDDLYIKMNGRGKPLTEFETFKARYEQELVNQFEGEPRSIGDQVFSIADFVARRMDTAWADLFWKRRDPGTKLFDAVVMNFFRTVAMVSRNPDSKEFPDDASRLRNQYSTPGYSAFQNSGWMDREFTEILIAVLETWTSERGFSNLPTSRYFDESKVFEMVTGPLAKLPMTDIVLVAGYCRYLRKHETDLSPELFEEWMRVLHNLAVNSDIERPEDLLLTARGLRQLLEHSTDILEFMSCLGEKDRISGFLDLQVKEEALKAWLILSDPGWKPLLLQAEQHGYFKGQIDFLLDFSGVREQWNAEEDSDWSEDTHREFQTSFAIYFGKATKMFSANGLADLKLCRWERALLVQGDYTLPGRSSNLSFLIDSPGSSVSWKRLLSGRSPSAERRPYLKMLWDKLPQNQPIPDALDGIIDAATGLSSWIDQLVRTPEAIGYCTNRWIRWNSESEIYLLRKQQMNGDHVELYTYCLHHNTLVPMLTGGMLAPLEIAHYFEVSGTFRPPQAGIKFTHGGKSFRFCIFATNLIFKFSIALPSLAGSEDLMNFLRNRCGFTENDNSLERLCLRDAVEGFLVELAGLIAEFTKPAPAPPSP